MILYKQLGLEKLAENLEYSNSELELIGRIFSLANEPNVLKIEPFREIKYEDKKGKDFVYFPSAQLHIDMTYYDIMMKRPEYEKDFVIGMLNKHGFSEIVGKENISIQDRTPKNKSIATLMVHFYITKNKDNAKYYRLNFNFLD